MKSCFETRWLHPSLQSQGPNGELPKSKRLRNVILCLVNLQSEFNELLNVDTQPQTFQKEDKKRGHIHFQI